jgi:hypothetical protein
MKKRQVRALMPDMQAILDSGVFDIEPPVAVYDMAIERPDMLQKFAQPNFVDRGQTSMLKWRLG